MEALDEIITAVSEVILVFEQAQNEPNVDLIIKKENFEVLIKAIEKMIDDEAKAAQQIDDPDLKQQMLNANSEIFDAKERLRVFLNLQKPDAKDTQDSKLIPKSSFDLLHKELEAIVKCMVKQLKITDQCNVKIIMDCLKRNLECVIRIKNVENANGLALIAREATKYVLELQVHLQTRMAELTDPDLRKRLQVAADSLKANHPVMISTCQQYFENKSAENAQQKERAIRVVVEAIQEIMVVIQTSAKFISDFSLLFQLPEQKSLGSMDKLTLNDNDSNTLGQASPALESRPMKRSPRVEQELGRLYSAAVRRNQPETAKAADNLVNEVQQQVQQAQLFASKVKNPQKQKEILDDCKELQHLTSSIVKASKDLYEPNSNKDEIMRQLDDMIGKAKVINKRIVENTSPELLLAENATQLELSSGKLMSAVRKGDRDGAIKAASEVTDQLKQQIELGRLAASEMKEGKNKDIVLECVDKLEKLAPLILHALKKALENPNDLAAQQELERLLQESKDLTNRMNVAILEDKLADNNELMTRQLDNLLSHAKRGEKAKAADAIRDVSDTVRKRIELGKALASQAKDPAMAAQIKAGTEQLEKKLPELIVATKDALEATPENTAEIEKLTDIIDEIKHNASRITASKKVEPFQHRNALQKSNSAKIREKDPDATAEEIIQNTATINDNFDRLLNAVAKGNQQEAVAAAKEVTGQISQQVALGRHLADSCADPILKKKILDACNDLEALVPVILQSTKHALSNPNDPKAFQTLKDAINSAKEKNKVIADAAEQLRNKDKIVAAARQVSKATKESQLTQVAEQKSLLDIASSIAKEMELLSLAAKNNSKADMITCAKRIAEMIGKIQGFSTEIANKCTDPILKNQLLSISKVPKNFAVQLKIISAVKATSGENDNTAKIQLVTCAQGLANSVVQTVKAAESASLKCPKA
mmetsp:Transcript_28820/g.40586  ORF Transcript_28820/g.40586 Transcript_28820/m.40586 type:complete len:941 (+) Transcript_28820:76-2898(+)